MRYYKLTLKATSELIKAKTKKINLRDYDYDNTLGAMNNYMYRNLENDISFFAYREDDNAVSAVFSHNDRKVGFEKAFSQITRFLSDIFSVNQCSAPCEITGSSFYEALLESKRRTFLSGSWIRLIDTAKLDYYESLDGLGDVKKYELQEKIVSEKAIKRELLLDESVKKELENIESHQNNSDFIGNTVHYFVSSKSIQAAADIAEAVMQKLIKANRIKSRRIALISEISPELPKHKNYFEEIIENNFGGVIIIDMREKFGCDSTKYDLVCRYLEKIFNDYKNDCLFFFVYNTEAPGFAYELLRSISKYIIPIKLKEGVGDRKAAVSYMKGLIKASEYSQYAAQAGEFMKLFPGNSFSQTDILNAFERFKTWCINKNVLSSAYDYSCLETFTLDRDDNNDSAYQKLHDLIGLESVKKQIDRIIASDVVEKERKKRMGKDYESTSMHMIFSGSPGTAKTTVAKLFAGIAKEKGILKSGAFVCIGGSDIEFMSDLSNEFKRAEGGVLFIDEAYAINSNLVITNLLRRMEENRDSVIVILAGYKTEMNAFLEKNDGLKSRIPYVIDFPDYSAEELTEIFKAMVKERGFNIEDEALSKASLVFEKARCVNNFGNGRYVRNFLGGTLLNQSIRLMESHEKVDEINKNELFLIKSVDVDAQEAGVNSSADTGSAQEELDNMIGLSSVKEIIHKVISYAKIKKMYRDNSIVNENPSLHMVFTGNPGTAKTTVARLFARIMKDEKILPTGNFIEVGRADLVGKYVGHTAPLVKKKFMEAQGGVLFIDEAYSLCDSHENSFGDEAINTIVQEMENHRGDVIVIFAGYTDKMRTFIERNPGMSSRIKFNVEFEDYTAGELCDITKLMLLKLQMRISDAAMEKLRSIYEQARKDKSFGNGRFVRKMIEEAELNLAERILKLDKAQLTPELITTIEEDDITVPAAPTAAAENKHIGF